MLTQFASEVTINFGRVERKDPAYSQRDEIERHIRGLMFGRGKMTLWSFNIPVREYYGQKEWVDSILEEGQDDEYFLHYVNKLPILQIDNGDYISLDLKTGVPTYLSHDGDEQRQGKPLGKNFIDFITRWSWTGLSAVPGFSSRLGILRSAKQRVTGVLAGSCDLACLASRHSTSRRKRLNRHLLWSGVISA